MRVSLISLVVLVTTKLSVSHNCQLRHAEAEEENVKVVEYEATTLSSDGIVDEEEEDESGRDADDGDTSDEDAEDAFNDIEDEDLLCANYEAGPQQKMLPHAVVIGVRKGGTRAVLEFINMNSRVRRAKTEIHYYDNHLDKGLEWYIGQMPPLLPGQIALEKTPGYFHTPGVAKRLWETNNRTKLVLILRNPVDRMISDYNQFRSRHLDRGQDYPPLEDFLFTENGNINIGYQPLQRSIYHYHLVRWMRYFPLSQIHIVDGDKFIREPWTELMALEKFLEIPAEITERNFFFNSTKGFYCGKEELTLPQSKWTCTRDKCLSKSKGRPKAKVEESTYSILKAFYATHNEMFYGLVKKNFGWTSD